MISTTSAIRCLAYLKQFGVNVLPEGEYLQGGAEFAKAVRADLEHADYFVQLLGPYRSNRPPDLKDQGGEPSPRATPSSNMMLPMARGLPVLQWRRPDLDIAAITHWDKPLLEGPDGARHGPAGVHEGNQEDDRTHAPRPPQQGRRQESRADDPIFCSSMPTRSDKELAEPAAQGFEENQDWMAAGPLFEGSADDITKDLDANLVDCGALLLVYGQCRRAMGARAACAASASLNGCARSRRASRPCCSRRPDQSRTSAWSGGFTKIDCENGLTGDSAAESWRSSAVIETTTTRARAPYPGLRAFRREETDLFFGREDCINTMVDRLAATRFLAVLGSSGTGKSSLVRTGLLDALELGLMAKAGSRWRIVDFRPGGAPHAAILRARLLETPTADGAADPPRKTSICCARSSRAARARSIEWCRAGHLAKGTSLLLLVDQFEELFRYQDYAGREEAEAFVALLLESAHTREFPIYVAITMRSEYLGACALIEGLADAINAGMFLTPRMTRDQCREAIVGPARGLRHRYRAGAGQPPAQRPRQLRALGRRRRPRPARPHHAARRPACRCCNTRSTACGCGRASDPPTQRDHLTRRRLRSDRRT